MSTIDKVPSAKKARKTKERADKKAHIAESAIRVLKRLGYANTGLRDIASEAGTSLGTLHYYFEDKIDLIRYCIESFESQFVPYIEQLIADSQSREELVTAYANGWATAIVDDVPLRCVWFDLKSQALFDPAFCEPIASFENSFFDLFAAIMKKAAVEDTSDATIRHAKLQGLFLYVVHGQVYAHPRTRQEIYDLFYEAIDELI